MKTKFMALTIVILGLAAAPALLAQGCCAGGAMKSGCSMMGGASATGGHEGHADSQGAAVAPTSTTKAVPPQPAQAVFDSYIKAQTALAQDSLQGFQAATRAITNTLQNSAQQALPSKVAQQSQTMAKAQDLTVARAAFKGMSEALIQYLKDNKVPEGTYHEAYCPMAKASWLQTETTIINPYMGKEMLRCGQFKS